LAGGSQAERIGQIGPGQAAQRKEGKQAAQRGRQTLPQD
jgi:hypothetical protein